MKLSTRGVAALAVTSLLAACAPRDSADRGASVTASPAVSTNKVDAQAGDEDHTLVANKPGKPRLPEYVPGELLVKFAKNAPGVSAANAKTGLALQTKRAYRSVAGLQLVKIGAQVPLEKALAELRRQGDVEYAEPNYIWRKQSLPNDISFEQQWGLNNTGQTQGNADADIDAPEAWDITTGSADTVVAVIDTGVDYTHPDLAPNMFSNAADCDADGMDDDANGYIDDCHGIDTASGDSDPMDVDGHGTHVAGIIAARGNNGAGVAGVAWNARVVACRFIDGENGGNTADAVACLDYIAALHDAGVNIVATNNSWGGGPASRALQDAIARQLQRGILFVTAAGNAGSYSEDHDLGVNGYLFESGAMYPCSYAVPNVICVSASTDKDELETFSYYGVHVGHLFAPGGNIYSTLPGGTYGALSGTSMATPHVTGVIALLKSANPAMGWLEARNRVIAGGDYITRDSRYPDFGWPAISRRRLNAFGALNCTNSSVLRRVEPHTAYPLDSYAIGAPIPLAVMHIDCTGPAGAVSVTIEPGNDSVALHDDGLADDQYAGDGVYSGSWTPQSAGAYTLTFPGQVMHYFPDGIGADDFVVNVHPFLKRGYPLLALQTAGRYDNTPEAFYANLDGGNDIEIVSSSVANGPIYAWKSDGSLLPGWPLDRNGRMYHVGYYSAGDMDGDPTTLEVAGSAADDGTNVPTDTILGDPVEAFTSTGQMLPGWPRASFNFIRIPPVMVDFDLDGHEDMILGGGDGYLRGLRYDAESLPGFFYGQQPSTGGQYVNTPLAADLDADGRAELVLTSGSGDRHVLSIINGASGTAVRTERDIPEPIGLIGIGDVDGDGAMNIIGTNHHSDVPLESVPYVHVLSPTGETLRTFPTTTALRGLRGSVLADLDGDGIPEIVVTQTLFDGYWQTSILEVNALRGDGSTLPGFPVVLKAAAPTISAVPSISVPVVGDVDGDGQPEIVANADGDLFVVNPDGSYVTGTPFRLPKEFWIFQAWPLSPGIADLDGDGRNDIILTSNNWDGREGWLPEMFVFDLRGPATHGPVEWGQNLEGAHRRGAYVSGKNLPNDAYLAIRTQGEGSVTSNSPAFQCQDHCLRKYAKNVPVTITAQPSAGGSFTGWRGACAGQGATCQLSLSGYAATSAIFSSKTLQVTVTGPGVVTSDIGGIQCPSICSAEFTGSQTVTLTATPSASATLVSWSGSDLCQPTSLTCTLPMNVARTVTARFEPRMWLTVRLRGAGTATADVPGLSCTAEQCDALLDYGTHVRLTAVPDAGNTARWAILCHNSTELVCEFDMTEQRTVSIDFLPRARITVTKNGTGTGTVTTVPAGIDCGATCTAMFDYETTLRVIATPGPDSIFTGWAGVCAGNGTGDCFVTAYQDMAISASFALSLPLQVTREGTGTVTSDTAGIDCGTDCTEMYAPGTQVRLTATPGAQQSFDRWSGTCQGTAPTCLVTMDQARSVTARFVDWPALDVTRGGTGAGTVTSSPTGINCGSDCTEPFAPNTLVTLTASASPGSDFNGWTGDCTGSTATCTVTLDQARAATAQFVLWPELAVTRAGTGTGTVSSSPAGIDCGSDCTESYSSNTTVTLTAAANSNSNFTGWSGACTGTAATCNVTLSAASGVTATFTLNPPTGGGGNSGGGGGGGGGGSLDWLLLAALAMLLTGRVYAQSGRGGKSRVGL